MGSPQSRDSVECGPPRHVSQFHHTISQPCFKIGPLIFSDSTNLTSDQPLGPNLLISVTSFRVRLLYFLKEHRSFAKNMALSMYSLLTIRYHAGFVSSIIAYVNKTSLLLVVYRRMMKKKDDVNSNQDGSTRIETVQRNVNSH